MKRLLAVVLGALLVLTVGAPGAAAWEPVGGAQFNSPIGGQTAKWRLVRAVDRAINSAPRGSEIYISTYLFDSKPTQEAILRAHGRGVQVQIAFGDDADNGMTRRIWRALNEDDDDLDPATGQPFLDEDDQPMPWGLDGSHVTYCLNSCRGQGVDNHAKYYVFTKTGTASNVVMVSSSNLNKGGAVKGWNDLYTVKGRPKMVDTYRRVHEQMLLDTPTGDSYVEETDWIYTTRIFPMRRGGPDPVMADLSKVRCKGANGGAGLNGRTRLNISMFYWGGARGEPIARRVIQLGKEGCIVQVTMGAPTRVVATMLRQAARARHIQLWDSRYDRNRDGEIDLRVHTKYLLINGNYGSDRSSWRVHTGSQNWGPGSLYYADENCLNIVSRGAYGQYMKNWRYVAKYGARRIGR